MKSAILFPLTAAWATCCPMQQAPQVFLNAGVTPSCQSLACYSPETLPPDIAFEELTQKLAAKQVNLIDVRLPFELVEDGMIPESKNLPLQQLGQAILKPDKDFVEERGFNKPFPDEPLVVTCLAGVRARTAQLALIGAGYSNVRVYEGSFEDWVEKGGKVEFPEAGDKEE